MSGPPGQNGKCHRYGKTNRPVDNPGCPPIGPAGLLRFIQKRGSRSSGTWRRFRRSIYSKLQNIVLPVMEFADHGCQHILGVVVLQDNAQVVVSGGKRSLFLGPIQAEGGRAVHIQRNRGNGHIIIVEVTVILASNGRSVYRF